MPSPTSSLATLRPDLAGSLMEFDLAMDRMGFIGHRVFPVFETAKKSGTFGKIPIEQLLQSPDTLRAPGSGYARGKFKFSPTSFACEEHGYEEPVDDTESEMYREYFDAELVSTQRALDAVLRNAEIRIAAKVFDAATWTGGSLTTAVTNEWDDHANATPAADVLAAALKVYAASGLWPNALVVNIKVRKHLAHCAEIVDKAKSQGFMDVRPGKMNDAAIAAALDIEELIVAGSPKNTANQSATASISPIWSDEYAMVCRVARTNDIKEPCIGRTLHWGMDGSQVGGTVESYREEQIRSDVIRCRHDVDEVALHVESSHLLSNITT